MTEKEKLAAAQAIMGGTAMPKLKDLLDEHGQIPSYSQEWDQRIGKPIRDRIAKSPVSDAAKSAITQAAQEYAGKHVAGFMSLKELYAKIKTSQPTLTRDQFLNTIMQGQKKGEFGLHPFTGARYQLTPEDYDMTIPAGNSLMQYVEVLKGGQPKGMAGGGDVSDVMPGAAGGGDIPSLQEMWAAGPKSMTHEDIAAGVAELSGLKGAKLKYAVRGIFGDDYSSSMIKNAKNSDQLLAQVKEHFSDRLLHQQLAEDRFGKRMAGGGSVPVMLEPGERVESPSGDDSWHVPQIQGQPEIGDVFPANLEPGSHVTPKAQVQADEDVQHMQSGGMPTELGFPKPTTLQGKAHQGGKFQVHAKKTTVRPTEWHFPNATQLPQTELEPTELYPSPSQMAQTEIKHSSAKPTQLDTHDPNVDFSLDPDRWYPQDNSRAQFQQPGLSGMGGSGGGGGGDDELKKITGILEKILTVLEKQDRSGNGQSQSGGMNKILSKTFGSKEKQSATADRMMLATSQAIGKVVNKAIAAII